MRSDEPKYGHCPSCGQVVNANPGESVPPHQPQGERGLCPGSGGTAQ